MTTIERWADQLDADHPVRWESADGREMRFLTREAALERLASYYKDPAEALDCGQTIRTPWAYYTWVDVTPDLTRPAATVRP
jgi:hypothetical protein